jgi:serine/threonine kinase PknH
MTVFICHSSRDHVAVRSLVQYLQTAHESVWLDQSLIGGEAWWQRILHQIQSCTVFVVALSNSCLQSKPCRAEMDYAKALGLPILPVIIGDVDSYRIDPIFNVQSVDLRNSDVASGAALIAAVRERATERKELPDPLPDPPPIPYEFLQRLGVAIDSPEELSPTEQSTMLADLRQALRREDDETVREDIRRLLRTLRRRSEVTLTTVDEIDELLHRYAGAGDPAAPPEQKSEAAHTAKASTPEAVSSAMLVGEPTTSDGTTESTKPGWSRRNPKTVAITAGAGILIAIIAVVAYMLLGRTSPGSRANKPATSTSPPSTPLGVAALDGLLLSPAEINNAMGATGIHVLGNVTEMGADSSEYSDPACAPLFGDAEASSYAGSGWIAVRTQHLGDFTDPKNVAPGVHEVHQDVVLFPTAQFAAAFYTASSHSWQACANRSFTHTTTGAPWAVGPVVNLNGTLATTKTQEGGGGWGCQRALTVSNNVAIDVQACSYTPGDQAVNIAHQIAAKVAKQ